MKRSKETWIISKVKYYWAFCNETTRGLSAILKNIYIAHEHQRSHDAFDVISLSQSAVFPPCRLPALFCARPKFRTFKKRKMLQPCGKPYGNACYAGYGFMIKRRILFSRAKFKIIRKTRENNKQTFHP